MLDREKLRVTVSGAEQALEMLKDCLEVDEECERLTAKNEELQELVSRAAFILQKLVDGAVVSGDEMRQWASDSVSVFLS